MPAYLQNIDPATAHYVAAAAASALANGERQIVEIDGQAIALFNVAGTYYAIADLCSHDDGPVAEGNVYGYEIECPRHGARFDMRTGQALSFPAPTNIQAYPVKVVGGQILIGLPPPA